MTHYQACSKAQRLAVKNQADYAVVYDPTDPDNDGLAYNLCWCATNMEDVNTFYAGCEIDRVFGPDGRMLQ